MKHGAAVSRYPDSFLSPALRRPSGVRLFVALSAVLFVMLAAEQVPAQDYSLYGDLEVTLGVVRARCTKSTETVVTEALMTVTSLRANHVLSYPWGEVDVRHQFRVTGGYDDDTVMTSSTTTSSATTTAPSVPENADRLRHTLYNAAIVWWPTDTLTIHAGRHSIPWGLGAVFFPADALHPQRTRVGDDRGFDGLSTTWTITPRWTVSGAGRVDTAVGVGKDPLEDLRWAAQVSGYVGALDMMVSTVYQPHTAARPALGFSYPVGEVILHVEGAWELIGGEDPADGKKLHDGATHAEGEAYPSDAIPQSTLEQFRTALSAGLATETGPAITVGAHYSHHFDSPALTGHVVTIAGEYLYADWTDWIGSHVVHPLVAWNGDGRWMVESSAFIDPERERALIRLELTRSVVEALTIGLESMVLLDEDTRRDSWDGMIRALARAHF